MRESVHAPHRGRGGSAPWGRAVLNPEGKNSRSGVPSLAFSWVQLPKSVAEARAGLIPSCETDANPPPEGLTAGQLLAWYRGLPVALKIKPERIWVRLPKSVVKARAGLIPSYETDANPPPEDLTADELLAWHRGLPVELRIK